MHFFARSVAAAVLIVFAASCSSEKTDASAEPQTTSSAPQPSSSKTSAKQRPDPDKVLLTEADITDRPYKVIEDISVKVSMFFLWDPYPTKERVAAKLRKEAAELGADAVILVRYGSVGMGFNFAELNGKGRAVAFTNP